MAISDDILRQMRVEEFRKGARERVAKMPPKQRANLQPVADWVSEQIDKLKREKPLD